MTARIYFTALTQYLYGCFWLYLWPHFITRWFCDADRTTWQFKVASWWLSQAGYARNPLWEVDVYEWRNRK